MIPWNDFHALIRQIDYQPSGKVCRPPFPLEVMLRGSIAENDTGAERFIAQVSLYSQSLGVAIAQTTYASDTSGEI